MKKTPNFALLRFAANAAQRRALIVSLNKKGIKMNSKNEKIEKIRNLLNEVDNDLLKEDESLFLKNFNALELPSLICSIVDYLQPRLFPYEAAIYWYLFRNSVLSTGQQYIRTSVRGMFEGVITSSSGQGSSLSYASVQKALQGLEDKKIIIKSGDTNREGTLYQICIPDEIPICQEAMKKALVKEEIPINLKKELDYYNVPENRLKVFERDEYKCHYCKKQLTRFSATLDHIQPVSKSGDHSFDNLITSCLHCNSERGNHPIMDAIIKQDKS